MADLPRIHVRLGDRAVALDVPTGWEATIARPQVRPRLADLNTAIAAALARPIAGPTLPELAARAVAAAANQGRRPRATVAVTDATRDCPDDRFLPPLLAEMEAGGMAGDNVTIIVATGLHRASTDEEKRRMFGGPVVDRYRIVDHDAQDPAAIVDLGRTSAGIPITTNRLALEADLLVSTGVVEPHQYAGFSGGAKTVAIGVAGEPTITATHGIAMLDEPGVRLARLDGNPFHEAIVEIAGAVGLDFVVNVVADADGRPLAVAAGEPETVHRALADIALEAFAVPVAHQADVAIAGVGAANAANLYQATRAVTYLHFAPIAVVRAGGVYLLPATIPEGAGTGLGERRFFTAMRDAGSPPDLVERLRRDGARGGEQRAFMVASAMRQATIVVIGAERPEVPEACGMRTAPTLAQGLALAGELVRETRPAGERDRAIELLVIPDAIRTLPIVAASPGSDPSG